MILLISSDYIGGFFLQKQVIPYHHALSFQEFYSTKENIDIIFLGSSHAYRSFDTPYFATQTQRTVFNLGTSGQNSVSTYYILEEIYRKKFQPKIAVIEGYWPTLTGNNTDFTSTSYLYQVMEPSIVKIGLWKDGFSISDKVKLLSYTFTFRDYFRNIFWQPDFSKSGEYQGKGYMRTKKIVSKDVIDQSSLKKIKKIIFNDYRLHFFEKTIAMAKSNGTKTMLVVAPIPPTIFLNIEDKYLTVTSFFKYISLKYNIEYIDYNIINKTDKFIQDTNFSDEDHLNQSGVSIMNDHFYKNYLKKYL